MNYNDKEIYSLKLELGLYKTYHILSLLNLNFPVKTIMERLFLNKTIVKKIRIFNNFEPGNAEEIYYFSTEPDYEDMVPYQEYIGYLDNITKATYKIAIYDDEIIINLLPNK